MSAASPHGGRRPVPARIPRPEYVDRPAPARFTGSEVKDAATVEAMRRAGRVAARALAAAGAAVAPGVTTDELDAVAHESMVQAGAYPSTLGYRGFTKSCCTSVNEVVCHGIPGERVLREGDIVNIDVTAYLDGVHGDTNATFAVGRIDDESQALLDATAEALARGIAAVRPGRELNVVGRVVENHAKRRRLGVVREYTGHGIGTAFHTDLVVPHYDSAPQHAEIIESGMTFTIEPMLTLGSPQIVDLDDGWTVVTADGRRSAQFEHTVLVTDTGAEILTLP